MTKRTQPAMTSNTRRATTLQPTRRTRGLAAIAVLACWAAAATAAEGSAQSTATLAPVIVLSTENGGPGPNQLMAIKIRAALNNDPLFRGSHFPVTVAVGNGKVLLRGIVYNEASRAHAASVAQAIPGVQGVVNELETLAVDG